MPRTANEAHTFPNTGYLSQYTDPATVRAAGVRLQPEACDFSPTLCDRPDLGPTQSLCNVYWGILSRY